MVEVSCNVRGEQLLHLHESLGVTLVACVICVSQPAQQLGLFMVHMCISCSYSRLMLLSIAPPMKHQQECTVQS